MAVTIGAGALTMSPLHSRALAHERHDLAAILKVRSSSTCGSTRINSPLRLA